jgi:SAM-dependent methyltransferase
MLSHRKIPVNLLTRDIKILDIGCGRNKLKGSMGLDQYPFEGVDIVTNLEKPLPISDKTFDLVFANQVLEHVHNLTLLLVEIHRILKPGGQLLAHVPYFRSSWAHIDPTHIRSFTLDSLDYYVQDTWLYDNYRFCETSFCKIEKFLDTDYPSTITRKIFTNLALRNSIKFENSLLSFIFPFEQLSYLLTK